MAMPGSTDVAGETAPLLRGRENACDPVAGPEGTTTQAPPGPDAGFPARQQWRIVWLLSLGILCFTLSSSISSAPTLRLMEDNICRQFYDPTGELGSPIDEKLCKEDKIQAELAYLEGYIVTLEAVIGLAVALPYGILADKVGRKPILLISTAGWTLSAFWVIIVLWFNNIFSVWWVLASGLFQVVGGGNTVSVAVLYSIVADVASEADRASYFFFMAFFSLGGNFVGPLIGSKLMATFTPWLPTIFGTILMPSALIFLSMIPETLPLAQKHSEYVSEGEDERDASFRSHLRGGFNHLRKSFRMLNLSLCLILAVGLSRTPEGLATTSFFIQYVSKRFEWSIASAGYLLGVRGIINALLLLVVLPTLSKLLESKDYRFQMSTPAKDLYLARLSAFFAASGAVFLAGSSIWIVTVGLVVNTLASGFAPLLRSLSTSFVEPQDTSKLYTLIAIMDTVGSLYAGPVLAWLFETGMRLQGLWVGLPYFWLAGVFAVVLVILLCVRLPPTIETEAWDEETVADGGVTSRYED
ncbi:MFS general substrate transporter [Thozetella sp. PMI_491]|nr:MFS general substrate transporter [Thozetella sp. PMI_491]